MKCLECGFHNAQTDICSNCNAALPGGATDVRERRAAMTALEHTIFACALNDAELTETMQSFEDAFLKSEPFEYRGLTWNLTAIEKNFDFSPNGPGVHRFVVRGLQVPTDGIGLLLDGARKAARVERVARALAAKHHERQFGDPSSESWVEINWPLFTEEADVAIKAITSTAPA